MSKGNSRKKTARICGSHGGAGGGAAIVSAISCRRSRRAVDACVQVVPIQLAASHQPPKSAGGSRMGILALKSVRWGGEMAFSKHYTTTLPKR